MLEASGLFSQAKPEGSPDPLSGPLAFPVITDRSLSFQVKGITVSFERYTGRFAGPGVSGRKGLRRRRAADSFCKAKQAPRDRIQYPKDAPVKQQIVEAARKSF